eukprot:289353_1
MKYIKEHKCIIFSHQRMDDIIDNKQNNNNTQPYCRMQAYGATLAGKNAKDLSYAFGSLLDSKRGSQSTKPTHTVSTHALNRPITITNTQTDTDTDTLTFNNINQFDIVSTPPIERVSSKEYIPATAAASPSIAVHFRVLLHILDMATDFGVIVYFYNIQGLRGFTALSLLSVFAYRTISGFAISQALSWTFGIYQFLDIFLYKELYEIYTNKRIRSTIYSRWVSRMRITLQSTPQTIIQTVWILKMLKYHNLVVVSIIISISSILIRIMRDTKWQFHIDNP